MSGTHKTSCLCGGISKASTETTVLSLGAGVQSTVLALMACRGELQDQPDHIMFADTGNESRGTYEHLAWLRKQIEAAGIPFHRVTVGNIVDDIRRVLQDGTAGRSGQPPFYVKSGQGAKGPTNGRLWRKCTREYKLDPMKTKIRELCGVQKGHRFPKDTRVVKLLGISIDEASRMKPSRDSWEEVHWPLIDLEMTRWDCLVWLKKHGYPQPPSSACLICPFHSNAAWRKVRDEQPEEFEATCGFDDDLRRGSLPGVSGSAYLHRSCVPLREIDFDADTNRGQGELALWGGECEGICGT